MTLPDPLQRLAAHAAPLRGVLARWRGPLTVLGVMLFASGSWLSFRHLGVSPAVLRSGPLLALILLAPVSLLYGGIGLQLLALGVGTPIRLGPATARSAYATLAEILPIPGGAIVRTSTLMAQGARVGQSWTLVLLAAILWISLAMLGCAATLLARGLSGGAALALLGGAATFGASIGLARFGGWRLAALNLLHRLTGLALIALRLRLAFQCIGVAVAGRDTLPFALANVAGSAASIAPAGLGISESFAAGAAAWVAVAPAAGFLAVGLDRIILLIASGGYTLAGAGSATMAKRIA